MNDVNTLLRLFKLLWSRREFFIGQELATVVYLTVLWSVSWWYVIPTLLLTAVLVFECHGLLTKRPLKRLINVTVNSRLR